MEVSMKKALAIALLASMITSPAFAAKSFTKRATQYAQYGVSGTENYIRNNPRKSAGIAAAVVVGSYALYKAYNYFKNKKANA